MCVAATSATEEVDGDGWRWLSTSAQQPLVHPSESARGRYSVIEADWMGSVCLDAIFQFCPFRFMDVQRALRTRIRVCM